MIDNLIAQETSIRFENRIGGILKKYGHNVTKLDKDIHGRKPDFLITNSLGEKLLVECKYVVCGGITEDGEQISMLNPNLHQSGVFEPNFQNKYYEVLLDARDQYNKYVSQNTKVNNKIPFVVALDADFLAKWFRFLPSDIYGLKEISAIIYIVKNKELDEELYKYSIEDLEKIDKNEIMVYKPQPSVRFFVLSNPTANIKFNPDEFLNKPIIKTKSKSE